MFDDLTSSLGRLFKRLKGEGTVRERHLNETLDELRLGLLQADVAISVADSFCQQVREKALGAEVLESLSPAQHVVKIVRDELVSLLGDEARPLKLPQQKCGVVLLVGLQGSGKTTTAAKLARHLKEHGKISMLVSADFARPAAREQLRLLGEQVGVRVATGVDTGPLDAVKAALKEATTRGFDVLIVDSAGRLHVDDQLMTELKNIVKATSPVECLFVADAMTGQDAVRSASAFAAAIPVTGIVLTKLDGDARGGAALSMARVTGKPVRYVGVGEKPEDFELFRPDRMASRILGMGDILGLIEKAEKLMDKGDAAKLTEKARKGDLTLEDFRDQLRQVRKLGSLDKVLEMLPGGAAMKGKLPVDESWSVGAEAIINSMTPWERSHSRLIDGSRKRRISLGCGRPLSDVNRLLKSFRDAKEMHQKMLVMAKSGRMPRGMPGMPGFPGFS